MKSLSVKQQLRSGARLYRNGHHLVLSGADTLLLREAAGRDVQQLRQACENIPES
tara:strand:- start:267 stop:431 length:165 start_codon:yes stop_codon:yes gene_type:complete